MAFKIPEQNRITESIAKKASYIGQQVLELVSDTASKKDGFFFFPRIGKKNGYYYLVRSTVVNGWRLVAVNIPSEGRNPTIDEMDYIKKFFWDDSDVVALFHAGPSWNIGDNKYWLHLWQPESTEWLLPPIFENTRTIRKAPFHEQLCRTIKRKLNPKKRNNEV